MDWTQTLAIIASMVATMGGLVLWLNSNHREDMRASEERWKWLFDWAHYEIHTLKMRQPNQQGEAK